MCVPPWLPQLPECQSHAVAIRQHFISPVSHVISIVFPDLNGIHFKAQQSLVLRIWPAMASAFIAVCYGKCLRSRPRAALMPCAVCAGVWGSVGLCMPLLCLIPRWPVNIPITLTVIFEHLFKPDTYNHSYLESWSSIMTEANVSSSSRPYFC